MSHHQKIIALAKQFIAKQSITPDDAGCQSLIATHLLSAGFKIHDLSTGAVSNLYASHGTGQPLFVFAGHTDVVPPGPLDQWISDPFEPTERDGYLYGRGAADMKGAVAAMVISAVRWVQAHPNHPGTIALALTSDEEGPAIDGTAKIVAFLKQENLLPTYVLVGEASSRVHVGDAIKIGRRGSMHGVLTIVGQQGHIAYPEKADNPIHRSFAILDALAQMRWDQGNDYFSPSSLQFYDIQSGVGAANVIPGSLTAKFNIRFAPVSTGASLEQQIRTILEQYRVEHGLHYILDCHVSSQPYFSGVCELSHIAQNVIENHMQDTMRARPTLDTLGGTSDGRYFAEICDQVIELGVVNDTIHKVNECVSVAGLQELESIYYGILNQILLQRTF